MLRLGWSWPDLMAFPAELLDPLYELLQEQDAETRERMRRAGR